MPTRASFPYVLSFPTGAPVANGYIGIRLNVNGVVNNSQIKDSFIKCPLDSSGTVTGATFWKNSDIQPSGTYYIVLVFTSSGELVCGPIKVTI